MKTITTTLLLCSQFLWIFAGAIPATGKNIADDDFVTSDIRAYSGLILQMGSSTIDGFLAEMVSKTTGDAKNNANKSNHNDNPVMSIHFTISSWFSAHLPSSPFPLSPGFNAFSLFPDFNEFPLLALTLILWLLHLFKLKFCVFAPRSSTDGIMFFGSVIRKL